MSGSVSIRPFLAGDVVQLDLQPSQHMTLGINKPVQSLDDGRELEQQGPAWTAVGADGRILCCYGFAFLFPPADGFGGHALAWALLATGVGSAHVAITRFARETIANSQIDRIEAVVRGEVVAEWRWAEMVGLQLAASLRSWGPEGKTHRLYERVRGEIECFNRRDREPRLEALAA